MPRKRTIALTVSQIVLGGSIGLASGWLCFLIVELLLWRGLNRRPCTTRFLGEFTSADLVWPNIRECSRRCC